jgi:hydrogenase maturation factor
MTPHGTLPVGKLHPDLLARLLRFQGCPDPRVTLGPHIGEDAAAVDLGDRYLIAKSDPITFVAEDIGWYLVQVNANDLATTGAVPRWLLVTLLLPEDTATPEMAERIFRQVDSACQELHIAVVGGHTEVTYGLDRPLAVGHLLGEVAKDQRVATSGARIGDDIVLVKGIAIEGTSIIARQKGPDLRRRGYSQQWIDRAQEYLYDPGISIVREARLAVESVTVHAMHDPTEGGLATALHEVAKAANVGGWVDKAAISIYPESAALCAEFGLNPLGLISSGALLVILAPDQTPTLLSTYAAHRVEAAHIGQVTMPELGMKLNSGTATTDLPRFDQDEITALV